jgi:hypothetical protein
VEFFIHFSPFKNYSTFLICMQSALQKYWERDSNPGKSIHILKGMNLQSQSSRATCARDEGKNYLKGSQKCIFHLCIKRRSGGRFLPNLAHLESHHHNESFKISRRSVKSFKFLQGSKIACSYRKAESSLTLHCTNVHTCDWCGKTCYYCR